MSKKKRGLLKRVLIDIGGFGLILLGILTGWLPGPGGIPLILAGLGLLSLNYEWARKLLKNFDKKRIELTEKYLATDPKTSRLIDVVCLIIILAGPALALTQDQLILRGFGIALCVFGIIVLLSNQRRVDRIVKYLKHK